MDTFNFTPAIIRLEENTKGRDLIVGDLHGCYNLLMEKLDELSFNPEVDRLISVGDLIDRGPQSMDCLRLLYNPWFHHVLGNHEVMMLNFFGVRVSNYSTPEDFIRNGGQWVDYLTLDELDEIKLDLIPLLLKSPLALMVPGKNPYNVIHAQALSVDFLTNETMSKLEWNFEFSATWERSAVHKYMKKATTKGKFMYLQEKNEEEVLLAHPLEQPNLNLTYVGHNILNTMAVHRSHVFIDKGAYNFYINGDNVEKNPLCVIDNKKFQESFEVAKTQFNELVLAERRSE